MARGAFWDSRPADRGGQRQRRFLQKVEETCSDPEINAFMFTSDAKPGFRCRDIRTLCPRLVAKTGGQRITSQRTLRQAPVPGLCFMDDFRRENLATTVAHELAHSGCWLENDRLGTTFIISSPEALVYYSPC
jgi:hypothetical protein